MESGAADVVLGEVQTGLLQHSTALSPAAAATLLRLIPQDPVRLWERPVRHAASPEVLAGLDGDLPAASGTRVRAVGTVRGDVRLTAGLLLQASAHGVALPASVRRRMPWTHYLTRPGDLEALGTYRADDVASGHLLPEIRSGALHLGGVGVRLAGGVQASDLLDHRVPFPAARTTLRWAATVAAAGDVPALRFTVESPTLRTLRLHVPAALVAALPEFVRDVALHDWLLSTVVALVDLAHVGQRPRADTVERLRPAVDHLLHVWMPAARTADELLPYWAELERRVGLSRQWDALVRRIRDQLSLAGLEPRPVATVDLARAGSA